MKGVNLEGLNAYTLCSPNTSNHSHVTLNAAHLFKELDKYLLCKEQQWR